MPQRTSPYTPSGATTRIIRADGTDIARYRDAHAGTRMAHGNSLCGTLAFASVVMLTLCSPLAANAASASNAGSATNNSAGAATDLAQEQRIHTALARATDAMRAVSTNGGYLWQYTTDLSQRAGESPAPEGIIWFESPGTAAVGSAFLRAWQATKDQLHLDAAREVVAALAHCQLESGGWHYSGSFDDKLATNKDGAPDYKGVRDIATGRSTQDTLYPLYRIATTFDDGATQNSIRFLIDYVTATNALNDPQDDLARTTLERALAGMLAAQYPNGAWPQRYDGTLHSGPNQAAKHALLDDKWTRNWPAHDENAYVSYYTLNDRAIPDNIDTMLYAWKKLGDTKYLDSALRGGDFLIHAQFPAPSAGWAQQYDFDMRPAWGRFFEAPGIASNESRYAMEALLTLWLETGEEKYLESIPAALEWLQSVQIAPGRWARVYEAGTNLPIYTDKSGIHYNLEDISQRERERYGWQGNYRIPRFISHYNSVTSQGREAWQQRQEQRGSERRNLQAEADRVIDALNEQGRWLLPRSAVRSGLRGADDQLISTAEFIKNVNLLSNHLDTIRAAQTQAP